MSMWIYLANNISVGLFGSILSAAFCDALDTRRHRCAVAGGVAAMLLLQGGLYLAFGPGLLTKLYPLVTHLPLLLLLCYLKRKLLWPLVSVLTAYLCCQLRRWIALLAVGLFSGGAMMQDAVEIAVTLPLLLLLLWAAPAVRSLSRCSRNVQWQAALIPALSYGFDYITRIYTNWLSQGAPAAVEFMPFVCAVAYLIFLQRSAEQEQKRIRLEQTQASLNLQVTQAVREVAMLRQSQEQASAYRHDLRHHLLYLSACLENGRTEQAQEYIHGICAEIEAQKVECYCENETSNLILSAFAARAAKAGIPMKIRMRLPQRLSISDSDLCVLFSNALENALHACQALAAKSEPCGIEINAFEKDGKLFLQITNACEQDVAFSGGLPVTEVPGHGMGVRSICAIVERYGGVCSFSAQDGKFVLRLSL